MNKVVAVVTGGTRGIGLGIAERLAQRGFSLAITYITDEKSAKKAYQHLDRLKKEDQQILKLRGDAGDAKVVVEHHRTIRKELGPVSVLVNNAGMMPVRTFEEISVKDWDDTIRVNLNSAFYWCRQVVPGMKEMKFGRIINVSSIAARELGPYGITVNCVAPAFIADAGIFVEWSEEKKAALKDKVFVPRLGTANDVSRAFEYLLDSPFVTGVTLDVTGAHL